ncbi:hypothetical protein [Paenibacillus sp. PAMC21692]|uniref:hypothetical protein n=1 Tax=Paenibacillus sp. PAMC21692 TaxID=2762320 RepID=UPI00164CE40D|nr:hypothetical protein [Paenibacillus sp. PAMC21692]QNK55149.1 hypothetical protein H7F31_21290 [Paenibacillus sp. PAMC21692]
MVFFAFVGFYFMPVIAFLFIVALLRAIKKVVNNRPYTKELFWSGVLFATITWTIVILALNPNGL